VHSLAWITKRTYAKADQSCIPKQNKALPGREHLLRAPVEWTLQRTHVTSRHQPIKAACRKKRWRNTLPADMAVFLDWVILRRFPLAYPHPLPLHWRGVKTATDQSCMQNAERRGYRFRPTLLSVSVFLLRSSVQSSVYCTYRYRVSLPPAHFSKLHKKTWRFGFGRQSVTVTVPTFKGCSKTGPRSRPR
jgi:hypothetical protein